MAGKRQALTELEREVLADAAGFVLAREWPWPDSDEEYERKKRALESARDKL